MLHKGRIRGYNDLFQLSRYIVPDASQGIVGPSGGQGMLTLTYHQPKTQFHIF